MEASLLALGDGYEGMAAELFDCFISTHPQYSEAFLNPAAAQERMTGETLDALLGAATGAWWVNTTVTTFVDLHRNYGAFSAQDYASWFDLVIAVMARRSGTAWPAGASAAWQRQAATLQALVSSELARVPRPVAEPL